MSSITNQNSNYNFQNINNYTNLTNYNLTPNQKNIFNPFTQQSNNNIIHTKKNTNIKDILNEPDLSNNNFISIINEIDPLENNIYNNENPNDFHIKKQVAQNLKIKT